MTAAGTLREHSSRSCDLTGLADQLRDLLGCLLVRLDQRVVVARVPRIVAVPDLAVGDVRAHLGIAHQAASGVPPPSWNLTSGTPAAEHSRSSVWYTPAHVPGAEVHRPTWTDQSLEVSGWHSTSTRRARAEQCACRLVVPGLLFRIAIGLGAGGGIFLAGTWLIWSRRSRSRASCRGRTPRPPAII